jgi:broad specificity phosphatase PhoE
MPPASDCQNVSGPRPPRHGDEMREGTRATVRRLIVVALLGWTGLVAQADESVWDALREPGSVVVLRHSYAPGTFDPPTARLDDCSTQRNLDAAGRAQATRVGEAFRKNRIAVGDVLSSPRCRCMDTARLAFGRAQAWGVLQGSLNDTELRRRQVAEMRSAMTAHPGGPPLVLVTHGSVVTDLTGLAIRMGELVVLRRAADGTHGVAGRLYVE